MQNKLINNVNDIAHMYFEKILPGGAGIIVDGTCGNGNDTLFLAKLAPEAKIYAFDIQDKAIENTKALLGENNIQNVTLICDSHAKMGEYVTEKIDLAVFNLGYLPGADKSLTTKAESTLSAIKYAVENLSDGGYISICAYLGHEGAADEYEALRSYLETLKNREFNVALTSHINRRETSPVYILVEKI